MSEIEEMKNKYFKTGYNATEEQFEQDLQTLIRGAVKEFASWHMDMRKGNAKVARFFRISKYSLTDGGKHEEEPKPTDTTNDWGKDAVIDINDNGVPRRIAPSSDNRLKEDFFDKFYTVEKEEGGKIYATTNNGISNIHKVKCAGDIWNWILSHARKIGEYAAQK